MDIIPTINPDVFIIRPNIISDERGFFFESWNKHKFNQIGLDFEFVQDNHSHSKFHTLRGLHYQTKNSQGKLVRCTKGKIFDVALDLRKNTPTFGQWVGEYLSSECNNMLWIPPGFAHGFYVVSEYADFQYKCTDYYNPEAECCIIWNDSYLDIDWPINKNTTPTISPKDQQGVLFKNAIYFE